MCTKTNEDYNSEPTLEFRKRNYYSNNGLPRSKPSTVAKPPAASFVTLSLEAMVVESVGKFCVEVLHNVSEMFYLTNTNNRYAFILFFKTYETKILR